MKTAQSLTCAMVQFRFSGRKHESTTCSSPAKHSASLKLPLRYGSVTFFVLVVTVFVLLVNERKQPNCRIGRQQCRFLGPANQLPGKASQSAVDRVIPRFPHLILPVSRILICQPCPLTNEYKCVSHTRDAPFAFAHVVR